MVWCEECKEGTGSKTACIKCYGRMHETIVRQETTIHGLMAEIVLLKEAMEVMGVSINSWHIAYEDMHAQVERLSEAAHAAEGKGAG